MPRSRFYWPELLLLLVFFGLCIYALTMLPLHNDEGLHLTRAVEVWSGHPFYDIQDGKVIGVWLIALFYPQSSPVFAGRIATVFVGLIGLAAGITLGRLVSKRRAGGLLAGLFWIACPYLFFFERMALADIEAGAIVVLLTLILLPDLRRSLTPKSPLRYAERGLSDLSDSPSLRRGEGAGGEVPIRIAVLAGIALGAALLFKVSAAPFGGVPVLAILLTRRESWRSRLIGLAVTFIVAMILLAPASLYAITHGGLFTIAFGWVGGASQSFAARAGQNITTFADTLLTVNGLWLFALIGVPLSLLAGRRGLYLLGCALGPLAVMLLFGTEVLDRHFGVVMPLLVVISAVGWTSIPVKLSTPISRLALAGAALILFAWGWLWVWRAAYTDPPAFPMTAAMQAQYITDHPSGYGLREAVQAFPQTVGDQPVIASMTTDGCKRARYYLLAGTSLECTGVGTQSQDRIEAALQANGIVYVLAEDQPVGIDPATIPGTWASLAVYPRPGNATRITLWRVKAAG